MSEENEQTGAPSQEKQPVEFTHEQQVKLNELINQAHGKAYGKAQKEHSDKIAALEAQIAKLTAKPDKTEKQGYDEDAVRKLVDGVRAEYEPQVKGYQDQIGKLMGHQRNAAIVSAAARANAVDPDVVASLMGDRVGFDDEHGLIVIGSNGQPELNSKAAPKSVEEAVREFLDAKPYLKKASNSGGAGSSTQAGVSKAQGKPRTWAEAAQQLASEMR